MPEVAVSADLDFQPARMHLPKADRRRLERGAIALLRREHAMTAEAARACVRAEIRRRETMTSFRSATYQVAIGSLGDDQSTLSVKRNDREPIFSRDDLIAVGARFQAARFVSGELYPCTDRVTDTANQYWLHAVPWDLPQFDLREAAQRTLLGEPVSHVFWKLQLLPLGAARDWREVQAWKDRGVGPDHEAMDLLHPESRGRGPLLLIATRPGWRFPVGFRAGQRSDAEIGLSRQRPGSAANPPRS